MLAEMVRVTRPGERVAVIVRTVDMWRWINLPLRSELKARLESPARPGPGVEKGGCADASLYHRFQQAGLAQVGMFPQWATYVERSTLQWQQDGILATLSPEEAIEWQAAVAQAEAEGTFFIADPYHCAVGTKP